MPKGNSPIPLGVYMHFKKGDCYLVTAVAEDGSKDTCGPDDIRVFYTALYGDFKHYHRTLADFTAQVPDPVPGDNDTVLRFSFLCANPLEMPAMGMQALATIVPFLKEAIQNGARPIFDLPTTPPA